MKRSRSRRKYIASVCVSALLVYALVCWCRKDQDADDQLIHTREPEVSELIVSATARATNIEFDEEAKKREQSHWSIKLHIILKRIA